MFVTNIKKDTHISVSVSFSALLLLGSPYFCNLLLTKGLGYIEIIGMPKSLPFGLSY